jgi:transposase
VVKFVWSQSIAGTRMTGKRTRYTVDFEAKVALEALRGELPTAQLAVKHGSHQTIVGEWTRQAMEGLTAVFSRQVGGARERQGVGGGCREAARQDRPALVERDFLAKVSGR